MAAALVVDIEKRHPGAPPISVRLELPLDGAGVTILFGPSGAGKTTLLRCIAGLERPDAGTIRLGPETFCDVAAGRFLPPQARRLGVVFQEQALFPHLSVARNIAYGLAHCTHGERVARTLEMARLVGVEPLLEDRPARLSGGERQRVALARALAPRPRLLLLDEPLSARDAPARAALRRELSHVLGRTGIPALVVTHDRVEAMALGHRMAVLAEGRVRQVGPVHDVMTRPADLAVARVVGMENVLPARLLATADGLATCAIGSARLRALDPGGLEGEVYACIRAEAVVIEPLPGAPASARNLLAGTITGLEPLGATVRVGIDCGFPLVALVTREAVDRLDLCEGRRVAALVKAPAVQLVGRPAER